MTPQKKSTNFFKFEQGRTVENDTKMTRVRKFDISAIVSTHCSTMNAGKPPSVIGITAKSKTIQKRRELITDAWTIEHMKWLRYIGRRVYRKEE